MTDKEVAIWLQGYATRVSEILFLMKNDAAMKQNEEEIVRRYAALKDDLGAEYERYPADFDHDDFSDPESCLYIPAIHEAYESLVAEKGSRPGDQMRDSLDDARCYLLHYIPSKPATT